MSIQELVTLIMCQAMLCGMALEEMCNKYGFKTVMFSSSPGVIPEGQWNALTFMLVLLLGMMVYWLYSEVSNTMKELKTIKEMDS